MFDPFAISGVPYSEIQFIENLQAYNSSSAGFEMIELMKVIQESGNYYWQGLVFPGSGNTTIGASATLNGTVQIPQGTIVTSIQHYEEDGGAGFKFKLYDKGSKASIFYGDYSLARIVSSNMQEQYGVGTSHPPTDQGSNLDNPFGPGYLLSPFIINQPGVMGWEIVNLSDVAQTVQVLMCCAVPINRQSINLKLIDKMKRGG